MTDIITEPEYAICRRDDPVAPFSLFARNRDGSWRQIQNYYTEESAVIARDALIERGVNHAV